MKSQGGNIHLAIIFLLSKAGYHCCTRMCVCSHSYFPCSFLSRYQAQQLKTSPQQSAEASRRNKSFIQCVVNQKLTRRMSREARRCLFLSRMSGNGQGGECRLPTEGDTGFHCELQGYREQWSEGCFCRMCFCACVCLHCTQIQWMTVISLVLALLAATPCGSEVTYKVMSWLHGNAHTNISV